VFQQVDGVIKIVERKVPVPSDPRRDEWANSWLPMLRSTPVPMLRSTPVPKLLEQGISRATIYAARAGRSLYARIKAKLIGTLKVIATDD
jgi:hypothetical protein